MKKSSTKNIKLLIRKNKKLVLLLVITVLILVLVLVYSLAKNSKTSKRLPAVLGITPGPTASLSLSPGVSNPIPANNTIDVGVSLDTGGEDIWGVDVVLGNDPNKLEVLGITPDAAGTNLKTFAPVVSQANPAFDWTKSVNGAQIEFGAVTFDLPNATPLPAFNGNVSLATITLKAQPVRRNSSVQISVLGDNSHTDDSNVISANDVTDDLLNTTPATVKIKADPVCRAAVNEDQQVNILDLASVVDKWGASCDPFAGCFEDTNTDGNVNIIDLTFIVDYWGQECPVTP